MLPRKFCFSINRITSSKCCLSTVPTMNIFDRNTKRKQKDWAAKAKDANVYDYIKEEVGYRLADRVYDIKRKFSMMVDLGCNRSHIAHNLTNEAADTIFLCDMSKSSLDCAKDAEGINVMKLLVDEEYLPFRRETIDIVLSSLSLHWVNNLPGCFEQIINCLKSDGVFIGSMFAGQTLFELRSSLQLAELEREGGFAPHISPFVETRDIGGLLNRAGFQMITIDCDVFRISYPTMFELMTDLQGMAESNAAWNRKGHLHRDTMLAAAAIYQKLYGNDDSTIPATFDVFYFIGWKPHSSQPQPIPRGSQQFSLKDIKNIDEILKDVEKIELNEPENK